MSQPVIVIDTREQRPLVFEHLATEPGTLQSGDYSIAGLEHEFAIERKSIPDLLQSVTKGRDRFERELHRLRGFHFARILVVGQPFEVTQIAHNPKSVFSSLSAFECRYSIPVVWEPDAAHAARLVERWAWFYHRERTRSQSKAEPCTIPPAIAAGRSAAFSQ